MADDSGGLSIPGNENYPEWTFEQVLKALTDEGADLHTPAKASFFNVNTSPGASDAISYHAWGDYYYGVNVNNDTMTAWTNAINMIDEMMPDVARGKRGSMDLQSLRDLEGQIMAFGIWSAYTAAGMNMWADRLDSDDEGFRGKAASVIQWRLKASGDGLADTEDQVFTRHGRHIALAVGDAATELAAFNQSMSNAWTTATNANIRDWIQNGVDGVVGDIWNYIVGHGLQLGQPGYKLDAFNGDVASGKAYIKSTLQAYPDGDLTSAAGWQKISDKLSTNTISLLKSLLDSPAQTAITALAPKYKLATTTLIEITPPPPETEPQPDPGTGDGPPDGNGSLPPPPDGNGSLPPPPDGGGNDGGLPPPDGGTNNGGLPPPDGGTNDGGLPPPDGGTNNGGLPPPDGGTNDGGLPPPDGGTGGGGDGGLPPPDGGTGGGGDGGLPPPDGGTGGLNLPGGGGTNDLAVPGGGPDGNGGMNVPGGGNGAFVPSLVPPGGGGGPGGNNPAGGGSSIGPGGDGAFDENGPGDGLFAPPDGGTGGPGDGGLGDSLLPPGAGNSRTALPPGGGADGGAGGGVGPGGVGAGAGAGGGLGSGADGGFGSDPGSNFGSGALGGGSGGPGDDSRLGSGGLGGLGDGRGGAGGGVGGGPGGLGGGLGGVGSGPGGLGGGLGGVGSGPGGLGGGLGGAGGGLGGAGGGLGGSGAGLGGLGGGLGGGVGSGGTGGLGGIPSQLTGGSPGANGAPGSSGDGGGGVPFFPPMMGGQGAAGEKPQERERQTWLSEDEEIWGTRAQAGSGVIGRLDEEEFELEEVPLTGPTRRQRRADTPRRPVRADQAEREATETGEEAPGTA